MQEYQFDLVIKGTLRAYSPEHAEDTIEELTNALFDHNGVYSSQIVLKIGDNISPLRMNLNITTDIHEHIKECFNTFILDIFRDIEEFTVKPAIFDRTDYNDVRNRILEKIELYKMSNYKLSGGQKTVKKMTDRLTNEIYCDIKKQLARDIIGGIEVTSHERI
jgi:hypothetical protein